MDFDHEYLYLISLITSMRHYRLALSLSRFNAGRCVCVCVCDFLDFSLLSCLNNSINSLWTLPRSRYTVCLNFN